MDSREIQAPPLPSTIIEPTVGRVVHYYPNEAEAHKYGPGPWAAHITCVHGTRSVNLMVITPDGYPQPRRSVQLVQEGDIYPINASHCEWMPYQKGQAAKTEQLERQIAEAPHVPGVDPQFLGAGQTTGPGTDLGDEPDEAVDHRVDAVRYATTPPDGTDEAADQVADHHSV